MRIFPVGVLVLILIGLINSMNQTANADTIIIKGERGTGETKLEVMRDAVSLAFVKVPYFETKCVTGNYYFVSHDAEKSIESERVFFKCDSDQEITLILTPVTNVEVYYKS